MPAAPVIPVLAYPDVHAASRWLAEAFGFRERLVIGDHRIQLHAGDGAVILTTGGLGPGDGPQDIDAPSRHGHVMVQVEDVDAHHERAVRAGARVLRPPATYPYGERQYTVADLVGHHWVFSESVADVDPAAWGGTAVELD